MRWKLHRDTPTAVENIGHVIAMQQSPRFALVQSVRLPYTTVYITSHI